MVEIELQRGIAFVILEDDVIAGMVFSNQGRLEDQGFLFTGGADGLESVNLAHQDPGLDVHLALGLEIGTQALFKVDRLADVNHRSGCIFHQIAPRSVADCIKFFLERRLHGFIYCIFGKFR